MSVEIYKKIVSPVLEKFDSESMKTRAEKALHLAEISPMTLKILELFADRHKRFKDERLGVVLGEIELENPVMVAAGWDKQGKAVKALYTLGFAGVEVGTVPFYSQPGNLKPRQFLIGQGVALNRLGFNSPGAEKVDNNLKNYFGSKIPIGISIGKNKYIPDKVAPEIHALVAKILYKHASYFVINVSSPNTPGLRRLQDKEPLTDIAEAVNEAMDEMGGRKDLYVKIAPDLTNDAVNDVIRVVLDHRLTGIIAVNTTINPTLKAKYGEKWRSEAGGLSGDDPDYRRMATEKVAHIYKETQGKIEIIGVGGVKDAATALEKIRAGAKVVQVLTAIRGEGTTVAGKINRGLVQYMEKEGIKNINELLGVDMK
ncbi:MAG: quinone-dependent dihydroorotate dehydrogenase [Candidatus Levybacteria bacterium]|nr:quinone-dependent dihydroorotate dehydrogenase [Candidatus Levybacteria bacterium]